jgi:hypothetical protein
MYHIGRVPPSSLLLLLLLCLGTVRAAEAQTDVFNDRGAFNAASTNLRFINFDDQPLSRTSPPLTIDGLIFLNTFGPVGIRQTQHFSGRSFIAGGAGEITELVIQLPPGTTAVGCDQFIAPMEVFTSAGQRITVTSQRSSTFVGFVSDVPIRTLVFHTDDNKFSNHNPDDLELDDIVFGQKKTGDQPTAPVLLTEENTGRAIALNTVTLTRDPFPVFSSQNLSLDQHNRISLFAVGVVLSTSSDASAVVAQAEDAQHKIYNLPVEFVGKGVNFSWLTQVIVKLPDELRNVGDQIGVSISVNGRTSNKAFIRMKS